MAKQSTEQSTTLSTAELPELQNLPVENLPVADAQPGDGNGSNDEIDDADESEPDEEMPDIVDSSSDEEEVVESKTEESGEESEDEMTFQQVLEVMKKESTQTKKVRFRHGIGESTRNIKKEAVSEGEVNINTCPKIEAG